MCTLVFLLPPLIFGLPERAVLPTARDTCFLLGVAFTSFIAQILQTRGFQLTLAARAAAVGFTQVRQNKSNRYTSCFCDHVVFLCGWSPVLQSSAVQPDCMHCTRHCKLGILKGILLFLLFPR